MATTDSSPQSSEEVWFYGRRENFYEFSNFFPAAINVDGKVWPTTEHYFQAQKFQDKDLQEKVRTTKTPDEAAKEGRNRSNSLRKDWEGVKDDVMYKALAAKFTQHKELRQVLLGTGDRGLVEHTTNDLYWGDGGDGSGKNVLGRLLMKLREELRAAENS